MNQYFLDSISLARIYRTLAMELVERATKVYVSIIFFALQGSLWTRGVLLEDNVSTGKVIDTKCNDSWGTQAEAEVVPSSRLVKFKFLKFS